MPAAADVNAYLAIFARRRLIFAITFVTVFSAAAAYVLTQPKVYRATSRVQVLQPRPIIVFTQGGSQPDDHSLSLQTEAKKVESPDLADLASQISKDDYQNYIPASDIMESVKVATEDPDVLAISAESSSAKRAADIANYVREAYTKRSQEEAQRTARGTLESLKKQRDRLDQDLKDADDSIKAFKAKNNIRDVDPAEAERAKSIVGYGAEAELARAAVMAAQAELDSLKSRLQSMRPTIPVDRTAADPVAAALQQEIEDTQAELERARLRYDDEHPRVLALRDRLIDLRNRKEQRAAEKASAPKAPAAEQPNPEYQELQKRIQDQEGQLLAMKARASALDAADAQNRAKMPGVSPDYLELAKRQHAKDIAEKAYLAVLQQINEAEVNLQGTQGPANKVATAQAPDRPIRPNPRQTLALAAVLAALAGLSLAYLKESTDTGVHDPDDLLMRTGVMPLGFRDGLRRTATWFREDGLRRLAEARTT